MISGTKKAETVPPTATYSSRSRPLSILKHSIKSPPVLHICFLFLIKECGLRIRYSSLCIIIFISCHCHCITFFYNLCCSVELYQCWLSLEIRTLIIAMSMSALRVLKAKSVTLTEEVQEHSQCKNTCELYLNGQCTVELISIFLKFAF